MGKAKSEHKKLGWEILKLQAKVGEATSKTARKIVEAEKKKAAASTEETSADGIDEVAAAQLLKLKAVKISQKIYHAKKEIKKAYVKAKSSEIQRLNKRLKEAKKSIESNKEEIKKDEATKPNNKKVLTHEDIQKFEHELDLVKKLDMDRLSEHTFIAKLSKHPILGSHSLMAPYVVNKDQDKSASEATSSSPTSKSSQESLNQIIEARLTNTKPVKEHLSKLWDSLEHIVTGRKFDHKELDKKRKASETSEEQPQTKKTKTSPAKKSTQESDHEDESDEDQEDAMSDVSYGEHDDGYDSDGLPMPMNGRSASAASSMFVGSLNEGSKKDKKNRKDKNDYVDDKFDEIYGKAKKNRPGQRARREKAERKYGKEANHVKKAEEEARIREEKKAARKAKKEKFNARDASTANAQRLPNRRTIGAGDGSASIHKPAPPKAKPAGPEPTDPSLHPSWLAKKSEKAAVAAALSGAKSSKIVFEDSD
ncbi:hypothetical protein MVEG_02651 [Podila verticillata NRRL 6337]|nr:hypothetical protein MVEG_02651 [Podila verticillata NRRL 6337]